MSFFLRGDVGVPSTRRAPCFPTVGTVCSRRETVPLFRLSPNHLDTQAAGRGGPTGGAGGPGGCSLGFKLRLKAHSVHYGDRGR